MVGSCVFYDGQAKSGSAGFFGVTFIHTEERSFSLVNAIPG